MAKRPWEPSTDGLLDDEPGEGPDFASAVLQLTPSDSFENAMREALEAVDKAVKAVFGTQAYVLPFGSLVQGMHLAGSDLDLALEVPGEDLIGQAPAGGKVDNGPQVSALKRLMRKLPNAFRVTETRFWKHMKVPIIVLAYRSASGEEVEADISVGAVFEGVQKGYTDRVVRRLLARSPRAMHLARLIKLWAKLEKLNKAYDGFLNALGWTLMVLFFFLDRGEITCDAMQEEEPNEHGPSGDDGSLPPRLHKGEDFASGELELLEVPTSEDVADFFEWLVLYWNAWPEDTPEGAWGISLVDGTIIQVAKPSKTWADSTSFFIEDPGVRMAKGSSENVARSLKVAPWKMTLQRCEATAASLRAHPEAGEAWLQRLLQQVAAEAAAKVKVAAPAPAAAVARRPLLGQLAKARAVGPQTIGAKGAMQWSQVAAPAPGVGFGYRPPLQPAAKARAAWPQAAGAKGAPQWSQAALASAGKNRPWPGQLPAAKRPVLAWGQQQPWMKGGWRAP